MRRPVLPYVIGVAIGVSGCHDAAAPTVPTTDALGTKGGSRQCTPAVPDDQIALPIAPAERRVDLVTPVFSNPTAVTNALFPISNLEHVVLVGVDEGVTFRAETTLLPTTQVIDLGGVRVQTLVSQYVGYLEGRIAELALDWYGQADDGSVWYFGEDVFNYEDGVVENRDGTWLACRDGPVAMIMPANPQVGNVFRVENFYPEVFEEVEVTQVGLTLAGPLGPVSGAIGVQELHLDTTYSTKFFAPGYGEFSTGSGQMFEALAVALPVNKASGPPPANLLAVIEGARAVFDAAGSDDWAAAGTLVAAMRQAWKQLVATGAVPRRLEPLMDGNLTDLHTAVAQRDPEAARQGAIEVERVGLDVLVRYRPRIAVDFERMAMLARQLVVDADAEDAGGVASDAAILDIILDRLVGTSVAKEEIGELRRLVRDARAAGARGDFDAVLGVAERLLEEVTE